jgi:hypothetical protein
VTAKIIYSKAGSDPSTILWPEVGPPAQRWKFTDGTPLVINDLIGYGNGSITFADGRLFPPLTSQGSTLKHQRN